MQKVFKLTQDGKNKEIGQAVQEALDAGCDPTAILNDAMIGAMAVVGENFKKEIIFVPQMLAAARAMKAGVEVLKPYLATGEAGSAGTIILGTVAGDLHDIGKNLVGMMFESAGFEVIDLGVDVPIQTFIDEVNKHKEASIVALSALLTTTMPSLRDTVAALLEQPFRSRIKIMVGGAPISQEFADEIGADAYTEDAASAAERQKNMRNPVSVQRQQPGNLTGFCKGEESVTQVRKTKRKIAMTDARQSQSRMQKKLRKMIPRNIRNQWYPGTQTAS